MRGTLSGTSRCLITLAVVALIAAGCSNGNVGTKRGTNHTTTSSTDRSNRQQAAKIAAGANAYLGEWFAGGEAEPMRLVDVVMNANFVQRNYPQVDKMPWLSSGVAEAVAAANKIGLPVAYVDRLLIASASPAAGASLPKIESLIDAALYSSIWCDDPAALAAVTAAAPAFSLADLVKRGGYDATHAIGAAQLASENGCKPQVATGGQPPSAAAEWAVLRPLIVDREVDDLMLEACGIAMYRGLPQALAAARERIVDIQRAQMSDGAFGRTVGVDASPHATVWALRCVAPLSTAQPVRQPQWIVR